jgi:hypothetical protein
LGRERPDFAYDVVHLVMVDDKPGTDQDRAQMTAIGDGGELSLTLVRHGDEWLAEGVGR